jgi:hypothetical protein
MKTPEPRAFLDRLHCRTMEQFNSPGLNDWHWAALEAATDLTEAVTKLPPEPPKRPKRPSYYGAKGSLRNPHR